MYISDYIDTLVALKNNSFSIWGFLLTVSLGIAAFIGSAKSDINRNIYVIIFILFACFAVSNNRALDKNFQAREEIGKIVVTCKKYEINKNLIGALIPTEKFWLYNGISTREGNLIYQGIISALVLFVISLKYLRKFE